MSEETDDMKHNPTSRKTRSLGYVFSSGVFYASHARDFDFKLNEEELIKKALNCGFISECFGTNGKIKYKYNYNQNKKGNI